MGGEKSLDENMNNNIPLVIQKAEKGQALR